MKIKLKRTDNCPIIGRKKSLVCTLSSDLCCLGKASEKLFWINEYCTEEWSLAFQTEEMENNNRNLEFSFKMDGYSKTLIPIKLIYWCDDYIEDDALFKVENL
ncbi:hypothetical protein [Parabacteroides merdae]|jgi:hypothetical protein|uniref:hypothetical protein n=1 Tax=Parabacteroides merdae TaxID=46503 RepID=UPI0034A0F047